jgi:hypothetical protein
MLSDQFKPACFEATASQASLLISDVTSVTCNLRLLGIHLGACTMCEKTRGSKTIKAKNSSK